MLVQSLAVNLIQKVIKKHFSSQLKYPLEVHKRSNKTQKTEMQKRVASSIEHKNSDSSWNSSLFCSWPLFLYLPGFYPFFCVCCFVFWAGLLDLQLLWSDQLQGIRHHHHRARPPNHSASAKKRNKNHRRGKEDIELVRNSKRNYQFDYR